MPCLAGAFARPGPSGTVEWTQQVHVAGPRRCSGGVLPRGSTAWPGWFVFPGKASDARSRAGAFTSQL
eukprot:353358-Alexandrium_andersonii.AAC.1